MNSFIVSVEHLWSRVAHEVDVIAKWATSHQTQINAGLQEAGAVASAIDPAAAVLIGTVTNASQAAFGKIAAALAAGDTAVQGGMLSVPADEAFIQSIKDGVAAAKAIVPVTAGTSTANLPTFTGQPVPVKPAA